MKRFALASAIAALTTFGPIAAPADTVEVELEPIRHHSAELTVVGPDGASNYDPASLEALGARRMVTITPWREEPAAFEGVLLADVLEANGLLDVQAIRVIAENDYAVTIPAETWKRWPVLVATRVNGKPHSRRERGPIQFVLPMSDDAAAGDVGMVNSWVWMAARIEVVE